MARTTQREGAPFSPLPAKPWTPQQQGAVASNYSASYRKTPEHLLKLGASFYPNWHEDAQHIGEATGLGHEAGAAVMAHLSPSNEAEKNRIQAMQVVHGMDDRATAHMLKASEHASIAKGAEVRARHAQKAGDMTGASHWGAEHQKHSAMNATLRAKAGIQGTPLGSVTSGFIAKALRVKMGDFGEHSNALDTLGKVKIGDFGRLIADPHGYQRAPIDTHYHDVGVGMRTDIPYTTERGLSAVGRYENFQGAHDIARSRTNKRLGTDLSTGEFMGGIWYGHIQRKINANPSARQARRAVDTELASMRENPKAQPFLPERFGLRPSLGKMDTGR